MWCNYLSKSELQLEVRTWMSYYTPYEAMNVITYPYPNLSSMSLFQLIDVSKRAYKNTERHTAHTIVSWPNPREWVIVHTYDLMMMIRQSIYILSIITREIGKLKTQPHVWCVLSQKGPIMPIFDVCCINTLAPGRCKCNIKYILFKLIPWIDILSISCEIALGWMPQDLTDDAIRQQAMTWAHADPDLCHHMDGNKIHHCSYNNKVLNSLMEAWTVFYYYGLTLNSQHR